MPPPSRNWVPVSTTISPEVFKYLNEQMVIIGNDIGTMIDSLIWRTHLKPSISTMKTRMVWDEPTLARCFTEEALSYCKTDLQQKTLADLLADQSPLRASRAMKFASTRIRKTRSLIEIWKKTRRIELDYRWAVLTLMRMNKVEPEILREGAVEERWFKTRDQVKNS